MEKHRYEVPLSDKVLLTLEEAAAYSGVGINKIRSMSDEPNCPFVLWNASKRMIKRTIFEEFLLETYSI